MPRVPCKFFALGTCTKGDACPFVHGSKHSSKRNRPQGDQGESFPATLCASSHHPATTYPRRSLPTAVDPHFLYVLAFPLDVTISNPQVPRTQLSLCSREVATCWARP